MLRRRSPPVLAEVPERGDRRLGELGRDDLEAFEKLRGAIGSSRRVLTTGGEARSAVAVGLAAAAAGAGAEAVLVECDPVRPALAEGLGLEPAPGLGEYLRGEAEAPQLLQPVVLAGPATGRASAPLVCIVAGAPTAATDAAPLLTLPGLRHVAEKLGRAYDLVVAAGPPFGQPEALAAASIHFDLTIGCCERGQLPKGMHDHVDGLATPA